MATDMRPVEVRVSGPLACFTRPEMKVERVSYPVMTPSAAAGLLESIYWKPEFRWRIEEIAVLAPIRYVSIRRNEIGERQTEERARRWARDGGGGLFASEPNVRTQRHTLALRDVDYLIRAQAEVKPGVGDDPAKHRDQFRRRVARGRCFARPYLGCREFAADFREPDGNERPIDFSEPFGLMLHSMEFGGGGRGEPRFFQAALDAGVLRVPRTGREAA